MKRQPAAVAPATLPPHTAVSLPHAVVFPSPHNPRQGSGLDAKSIGELAASIREQGIIQDLLVRPWPAYLPRPDGAPAGVIYEIIAGERRWTAAGKLIEDGTWKMEGGKAHDPSSILHPPSSLPCKLYSPCTDVQAAELRCIENLQKVGLTKFEEAEGFRHLLDLKDAQGKAIHTPESIAHRVGKTPQWVYSVLKLERLPEPLKLQCLSGRLSDSNALLLARIPDPALQMQAAVALLGPLEGSDQEPLSHREAKALIQERFMRRLKGAPFDTAECDACPHRTANQRGLYPDVGSDDVCTLTPCYRKKAAAVATRQRAVVKEERRQGEDGRSKMEDGKDRDPASSLHPPSSAHCPPTTPSLHPSTAPHPTRKQLEQAVTTAANCVVDAGLPAHGTAWLRWLCLHGLGALDAETFGFFGVNGDRAEREKFLADRNLNELVALLVRQSLHRDLLTTPDHHYTPDFLAACQLAKLTPP